MFTRIMKSSVGGEMKLKFYLSEQGIGTIIQWGGKAVHHFKDLD